MDEQTSIVKIDQVKQLNTRLALKALIAAIFNDLMPIPYDGRYNDQINDIAEAIATDQVQA
jgi:hypothetical protein